MAQTTFTHPDGTTAICFAVPTTALPDVSSALADREGWAPETGIPKGDAARNNVIGYVRTVYRNFMADRAAQQARDASRASTDQVQIV